MGREKPEGDFNVFRRYGRYQFDPRKGLRLVPTSSCVEFIRREWVYAHRFLHVTLTWPNRVHPVARLDRADEKARMTRMMGARWRENMQGQMVHLAALLDYLLARKVRVQIVLSPYPAWHEEMPFPAAYREMVTPILKSGPARVGPHPTCAR
ncbi:MAG: hypothetical protein L0387_14100 [Acidobacteria bacterium]|nr:hypothetical protein [Acidobacteriota bacterium]